MEKIALIATNWDDILRVAESLKVGTVHASTLIQALQRCGRPTTLARAISEVGRIAKTLYLLNYIDNEHYRRRIQNQLNREEGRHSVADMSFMVSAVSYVSAITRGRRISWVR